MTDSSRISSVNYVFALGELKMHPYRTSEATRARSGSIRLNISQSVIRVVTIATLCLLGFSAAAAQRWQYDYGRQCVEHGRKGVQPVGVNPAFGFPAGYIAVGQTNSPTLCGTTDVYVIRTDLNGATVWEAVFNIAGNDIGYDIHECRFAPPGLPGAPAPAAGDLIIAGTTAGPVCGGTRINDAFLLRINAAGTVVKWLQTYGTAQGQEDAYDLVEATTGNNAFSTAPGDIVFSGLARNNAGSADGYIVRVKGGTGAQIWGMTYGGNANDEFRGVDEATVNLAAGATGDILAAGMSASFGGANQVMLVRVNGNNGLIGAAPQGSLIYGSNNFLDRAFAVQELTVGGNAGNIIVAGTTRGVPAGSASTNLEILLLKTGPSPCNVLLDQMYGDNGARQDFAMDVREIVSAGAGLNTGNIVVTGTSNIPVTVSGFGLNDVFLMEVNPFTLVPAGLGFMIYGGAASDGGESVAETPANATGTSGGFIVCGFERSNLAMAGDPQDVYLIKTNALGSSGCNELRITPDNRPPAFPRTCPGVVRTALGANCPMQTAPVAVSWPTQLCFAFPKPGADPEDLSIDLDRDGSFYPNPIRRGEVLTVMMEGATGAVDISVANTVGEIVSQSEEAADVGAGAVSISTAGWSAGTYMVTVGDGMNLRTIRVTVIE